MQIGAAVILPLGLGGVAGTMACGGNVSLGRSTPTESGDPSAGDPSAVDASTNDAAAIDGSPGCSSSAPAMTTYPPPGPPPSATCSTTGLVRCNSGLVSWIPAGPVVAAAGAGTPPVPTGGAVTPGDYQLVSEAVWGEPPPDTYGWPHPGDVTVATLHASCDTYNMVYTGPNPPPDSGGVRSQGGANTCGRLVPQAIPLVALAGYADAGAPSGELLTPYSATPDTLTLIQLEPYRDDGADLVEGSLTIVQEFALVGSSAPPIVIDAGDPACRSPGSQAARDPRCPASAAAAGEPCNPVPAPLWCEYGGDQYGRCTMLLVCALQRDGTFQFTSPFGSSGGSTLPCGTNPPGCPDTYASAMADEAGADAGLCAASRTLLCDYPEGVCGCGTGSSESGWTCAPRASVDADCPAKRPYAGDRCPTEGQQCWYGSPCVGGTWVGPPVFCANAYWERLDGLTNCPVIAQ
jgi:hypothetical protein